MTKAQTFTVRKSEDRGRANHGWLDARHTFSFAGYHDPKYMGFRSLRVINQDVIAPSGGFPTHPHQNMEIFSYIVEGAISHQDSMGNSRTLKPGEIQLMSAGSGVTHSEFNPSETERLQLLQIWIQPNEIDLPPSYTEWSPSSSATNKEKMLIISPDGREGSAVIHQDAHIYKLDLEEGQQVNHEVISNRAMWIQLIKGSLRVGDTRIEAGDAIHTEDEGLVEILAESSAEALLFDFS